MSFYKCPQNGCDIILRSKEHARRHYQRVHAAEPDIEKDTPEHEQNQDHSIYEAAKRIGETRQNEAD